jgi:hypothetical protein
VESAFALVARECSGVAIRRGVAITEPLVGASVRQGIPHIRGVRTSDGVDLHADLVIDAMGRRSRLTEWATAAGGRPPYEEASDAGFATTPATIDRKMAGFPSGEARSAPRLARSGLSPSPPITTLDR